MNRNRRVRKNFGAKPTDDGPLVRVDVTHLVAEKFLTPKECARLGRNKDFPYLLPDKPEPAYQQKWLNYYGVSREEAIRNINLKSAREADTEIGRERVFKAACRRARRTARKAQDVGSAKATRSGA